ncbi:hypothetical protein [Nitrospira moscoviensis]|uniref:DUF5666 domain-containing protein n=1 Tax=Nitrospira moscoviensis TaxID=42253 RepID=A0A0K2GBP4_NITMO|nr:hypothetical protein [Nitrospira moscoviensis]ALA58370.1 exported protein of unknown function [Nitrospira moscoviensis]
MMNLLRLIVIAVWSFGVAAAAVQTGEAATNFNGSTIIGIDRAERTVTFRTKEGEKWTLPVENPDLLKGDRIAQGDQVSIELDPDDRITKIVKPNDSGGRQEAREAREDGQ